MFVAGAGPGDTFRFQVKATDNVGNVGSWAQSDFVAIAPVKKYYHFNGQRIAMRPHSHAGGAEVYYLSGDHLVRFR